MNGTRPREFSSSNGLSRASIPDPPIRRFDEKVLLPTTCPFCGGRQVEPVIAPVAVTSSWRCRACERTWQVRQLCQDGG